MATRHSVRVGDSITAQPLAKILGFAYVKNGVRRIPHEIDAGAFRRLAEEVAAQPLDERLRIRKEKLLNRQHSEDSTRKNGARPVQVEEAWLRSETGRGIYPAGL